MDQPFPKVAPGSPLHRLLRLAPGSVPPWFCSRDSCTGFDLLIAVEVGLILGALLLGQFHGLWWPLAVAIPSVILFWAFVHAPFENRERWGRARRRRGECVWCGQAGVEPGSHCEGCGGRA